MNLAKLLLFSLLTIGALVRCSDDDPRHVQKPSLDIGDAHSITVVEASTGGRLAQEEPRLFKITDNGAFEPVKFVDANGTEVDPSIAQIYYLDRMIDLTPGYLVLTGGIFVSGESGSLQDYKALLVRKSDGAVFDFGDDDILYDAKPYGDPTIKRDGDGNIYYATNDGDVYKVAIDNPDAISRVSYLPSGQKAWTSYAIDAHGNCVYEYLDLRLKKVSGGIAELRLPGSIVKGYWIGSNGVIYMLTADELDSRNKIYKISVINDEVLMESVWIADIDDVANYTREARAYQVKTQNSVIFLLDGSAWEFLEDQNSVVAFESPRLGEIAILVSSSHYYYIATGTDLYKVDFATREFARLIPAGEYEMYAINVDDNDLIQFNGLRYSDGKKVFGEISSSGTVTILDEELDRKASVLHRIK